MKLRDLRPFLAGDVCLYVLEPALDEFVDLYRGSADGLVPFLEREVLVVSAASFSSSILEIQLKFE